MGKWSELKASEKARVIQLAIENGVSDIKTIRDTYNIYAQGGEIHIDPSKKGTFTAAASKHGKSVQAFASQILAHKENYSPAMVKKANFARNFGGHRHEDGGYNWRTPVGSNRSYFEGVVENLQQGWEKIKKNPFVNMVIPFESVEEIKNGNTEALLSLVVPELRGVNIATAPIKNVILHEKKPILEGIRSFGKRHFNSTPNIQSLAIDQKTVDSITKYGLGNPVSRNSELGESLYPIADRVYEDFLWRVNQRIDNNINENLRRMNVGELYPPSQVEILPGTFPNNPRYGGIHLSGTHKIGINTTKEAFEDAVAHEVLHDYYSYLEQPFKLNTQTSKTQAMRELVVPTDNGATQSVATILDNAYTFTPEFLAEHPEINPLAEKLAENGRIRDMVSVWNGGVIKEDLNSAIDNLTSEEIDYIMSHSSAYSRDWASAKEHNKEYYAAIKKALKTASVAAPVVIGAEQVQDRDKKSTGGPLYPFSFEKNTFLKTPAVRY